MRSKAATWMFAAELHASVMCCRIEYLSQAAPDPSHLHTETIIVTDSTGERPSHLRTETVIVTDTTGE